MGLGISVAKNRRSHTNLVGHEWFCIASTSTEVYISKVGEQTMDRTIKRDSTARFDNPLSTLFGTLFALAAGVAVVILLALMSI